MSLGILYGTSEQIMGLWRQRKSRGKFRGVSHEINATTPILTFPIKGEGTYSEIHDVVWAKEQGRD
ncbi:MAG: hypothetical protein F4X65_13235 [Chloroflexi bacterium]|nr:hypothetical protein [Chloroflexota bacterium]